MKFLFYELKNILLNLVFSVLVLGTLIPALSAARTVLHRLSFRTRRRLPFGLAGLFLSVLAGLYIHWGVGKLPQAKSGEGYIAYMSPHLFRLYVLYSGFVLISAPAFTLVALWWDFNRRDAEAILARDRRKPVLLLRSFEGDESEPGPSRDIEKALAKNLRRSVGPVIALGSPNDFSPPGGATRVYVSEESWQRTVLKYLHRATAIVFVISKWTTAVRWEVQKVKEQFDPERIVLIFPPGTGYVHAGGEVTFNTDQLYDLLAAAGVSDEENKTQRGPRQDGAVLGYELNWNPVLLAQDVRDINEFVETTLRRLAPALPAKTAA